MSRTDKDRPLWVKNTDETLPLVPHHEHLYRLNEEGRYRRVPTGADVCDLLSPADQRERDAHAERFQYSWLTCGWQVDWWSPGGGGYRDYSPPRWYVQHQWHRPERVRARVSLREAAKEYNAKGWEEDDEEGEGFLYDYPNYQHRHRARFWWS